MLDILFVAILLDLITPIPLHTPYSLHQPQIVNVVLIPKSKSAILIVETTVVPILILVEYYESPPSTYELLLFIATVCFMFWSQQAIQFGTCSWICILHS